MKSSDINAPFLSVLARPIPSGGSLCPESRGPGKSSVAAVSIAKDTATCDRMVEESLQVYPSSLSAFGTHW